MPRSYAELTCITAAAIAAPDSAYERITAVETSYGATQHERLFRRDVLSMAHEMTDCTILRSHIIVQIAEVSLMANAKSLLPR